MGKKMSEKRKQWLKAVAEADAIRKQKRGTGKFQLGGKNGQESNAEQTGASVLTERGVRRKSKPHGKCCIEVFEDDLPSYFRPCPGCDISEI
jgi:hypothetical protein